MAATPHRTPAADPVVPHQSRLWLLVWFVVQWPLIPLDLALRVVWFTMLLLGNGSSDDVADVREPLRRFLSPRVLLLRLSHDASRHEAAMNHRFARFAEDIRRKKFRWRTWALHETGNKVHPDGHAYGLVLYPREIQGVPLSTLQRLASAHGLVIDVPSDLKNGAGLLGMHPVES
ncbi:hypothetical protein V1460_10510 [Streptomyces sp. SCSIO 30461]|uniref:hypothetical protein n=1 Tax=Streptomyces sp. SCSIO 30461 TaxID=3118085 RepID=UPI0030D4C587